MEGEWRMAGGQSAVTGLSGEEWTMEGMMEVEWWRPGQRDEGDGGNGMVEGRMMEDWWRPGLLSPGRMGWWRSGRRLSHTAAG